MEIEEIEKLMVAMNDHQIHKLELKNSKGELLLEKKTAPCAAPTAVTYHAPAAPAPASTPAEAEKEVAGNFVTSPIVGTFYAASSPDAPPFVKVGDRVTAETVVCIVEAMKVMNEVKAGMNGVVAEVLLVNGDPVEFGTRILRIS